MSCLTKTLGRLLFVTIIVSSAYLHLSKPQNFAEDLSTNYSQFVKLFNEHANAAVFPPAQLLNWTLWSKVLGLFEVLIALLIVFGDCWGGFLLFVNLIISGVYDYSDVSQFVQWDVNRQIEFARQLFFVGAALALMTCSKSCKTSCPAKVQAQGKASSK